MVFANHTPHHLMPLGKKGGIGGNRLNMGALSDYRRRVAGTDGINDVEDIRIGKELGPLQRALGAVTLGLSLGIGLVAGSAVISGYGEVEGQPNSEIAAPSLDQGAATSVTLPTEDQEGASQIATVTGTAEQPDTTTAPETTVPTETTAPTAEVGENGEVAVTVPGLDQPVIEDTTTVVEEAPAPATSAAETPGTTIAPTPAEEVPVATTEAPAPVEDASPGTTAPAPEPAPETSPPAEGPPATEDTPPSTNAPVDLGALPTVPPAP